MENKHAKNIFILIVVIILVGIGFAVFSTQNTVSAPEQSAVGEAVTVTEAASADSVVTYQGEADIDALTLLEQKAEVEKDASGLVSTIDGREANADKREYWAFYVNGEMAPVGPAEYVTENGDVIEWKIEKY